MDRNKKLYFPTEKLRPWSIRGHRNVNILSHVFIFLPVIIYDTFMSLF